MATAPDAASATNLTHEEIWDDSVLIDSWNEALDEYKKYHSIHANGGQLEDFDSLDADSDDSCAGVVVAVPVHTLQEPVLPEVVDAKPQQPTIPKAAPTPPQMVLESVKDENLKKMLMAWYYAGYYTGVYQAQTETPSKQEAEQTSPDDAGTQTESNRSIPKKSQDQD